jgi:hypothetical protein
MKNMAVDKITWGFFDNFKDKFNDIGNKLKDQAMAAGNVALNNARQ